MAKKWLFVSLFFLIPVITGIFFYRQTYYSAASNEPYARPTPCTYQLLNPLRCEPDLALKKKEYVALRNKLLELIEQKTQAGELTSAAVYFRDLQNGPTLSINSQEDFIPASLLKLPLMLTYYKKAEDDPSMLRRKITVAGDIETLSQNIQPEKTAQLGETYTVDALITLLITQSDNTSWKVLLSDLRKNYSEEDFIATLSDLGIVDPRKRNDQQYITVQSYASIFRVLYNGSYLNLDMSDKALILLSQSEFRDGIVAGVPDNMQVAHKFGEQRNGDEQQLHDCGIVYYSATPYTLCVMTRGDDLTELTSIIARISKEVYEEIERRN